MGNRMDVQRTAPIFSNVRPIRMEQAQEPEKLSWLIRATNWIGITMARTETPNGWSFNPATATLTLVVLGLIAGGAYYMGQRDNESRHLLQRIADTEQKAESAEKLATYAVSGKDKEDEHGPNANKNKK